MKREVEVTCNVLWARFSSLCLHHCNVDRQHRHSRARVACSLVPEMLQIYSTWTMFALYASFLESAQLSTVYWRYLSCSHCFHPGYLVLKMITISPRINFFPTYDFGLTKLPLSMVTSISRADPFWQWALQLLPPLVKPIANAFWSSSNALDRWANWMKQHYLVSSHLVHFTLIFFCSRICCHSY